MAFKQTGAEELRKVVRVLDDMREDFSDRFTAEQLLQLVRMLWRSDWDIYPDHWSERQIEAALRGTAPVFDEHGRPV